MKLYDGMLRRPSPCRLFLAGKGKVEIPKEECITPKSPYNILLSSSTSMPHVRCSNERRFQSVNLCPSGYIVERSIQPGALGTTAL